jgi:carboxypeptidase Q
MLAAALICTRAGAEDVPGKLMDAELNSDFAYQRLAQLCDTFGPRFSGSTNLGSGHRLGFGADEERWLENVHGEEVMVPHWVRGAESAELLEPRARKLPMLGLGGSIATPPEGITAEVLVVKSFAD